MQTLDEQGQELGEEGSKPIKTWGSLQVLCNREVEELLLLFVVEEVLLFLFLVLLL